MLNPSATTTTISEEAKEIVKQLFDKVKHKYFTFNQIRQVENYLTMMFNRILSTNQILLQQMKKRLTKLDLNISTNQIHLQLMRKKNYLTMKFG